MSEPTSEQIIGALVGLRDARGAVWLLSVVPNTVVMPADYSEGPIELRLLAASRGPLIVESFKVVVDDA